MGFINQMEPWIDANEKTAVLEYLDSGGWLTEFRKTREFERMIAEYVGSKYCSVLMNGTLSLFVAMKALGISEGDEVIVPDFTMIASANAVVLAGAKPVFVDISLSNLCLEPDLTERAFTASTKAVMLVSINGRSPVMQEFCDLTQCYKLFLIEDAAQSLGSFYGNQHLGTFGHVGSFSFSAPKVITTGQGGALVTDDEELYKRILKIKDFGRRESGVDFHEELGYNFKFTDLQAVIGIEQMKKLAWRVNRKKEIFALYQDQLADISDIQFVETNLNDTSPWFIDMLVQKREGLQHYLKKNGIGSRRFYPAIHSQPVFGLKGCYTNTEYAADHGLWLPSSSFLSDDEIVRICCKIKEFYRE